MDGYIWITSRSGNIGECRHIKIHPVSGYAEHVANLGAAVIEEVAAVVRVELAVCNSHLELVLVQGVGDRDVRVQRLIQVAQALMRQTLLETLRAHWLVFTSLPLPPPMATAAVRRGCAGADGTEAA